MKIVTAIVKPFKLDEVRDTLTGRGVAGLSVDHAVRIRTGETDAAAL